MADLIDRQAAIDAVLGACKDTATTECAVRELEELPSAQPTLNGYDIRHLELIASVMQKENLPPERVTESLTDIGRIVEIITDEFEETLRKAVEQCTI